MLGDLSRCQHCVYPAEESGSLLLQAIRYLEDASGYLQKCKDIRVTLAIDLPGLETNLVFINDNINHSLKTLFKLYNLLFRRKLYSDGQDAHYSPEVNVFPSIESLALLSRPIVINPGSHFGRFDLRPRPAHPEPLLSSNSDANQGLGDFISFKFYDQRNQKERYRKAPNSQKGSRIKYGGADDSAIAISFDYLNANTQPIFLHAERDQDPELSGKINIETIIKPQSDILRLLRRGLDVLPDLTRHESLEHSRRVPCNELALYLQSAKRKDLIQDIKRVRNFLERQWESSSDGIPRGLVEHIAKCERNFLLDRDPTTDSIWNADCQEQRFEVYDEFSIGILYRQKCVCLEGALHGLDPYRPRNISFEIAKEDENLEWDEVNLEWRKKKMPRPTTPIQSGSGSMAADDEEADRLAQEMEGKADEEKANQEKKDKALAGIMDMTGLENIKEHVQKIAARIEISMRQKIDLKEEHFGTVFIGNSGTGKTTVARSYANYLSASGIVGDGFTETSGVYLADGGIALAKTYIDNLSYSGGILFVDDAHKLLVYSGELKLLDYLIEQMEKQRGKVLFVFAGNEKGMRKILGHSSKGNTGLLPYVLNFKDYSDDQLLQIMGSHIKKKFEGKMEVEGGVDGLYMRIAARRVGRDRGGDHFGNARAAENVVARMCERQSTRLSKIRNKKATSKAGAVNTQEMGRKEKDTTTDESKLEGKEASKFVPDTNQTVTELAKLLSGTSLPEVIDVAGPGRGEDVTNADKCSGETRKDTKDSSETSGKSDKPGEEEVDIGDYFFTKDDILGPSPSEAILENPAWKKLQKLTGLKAVKHSILNLLEVVKSNHQREIEEKPLLKLSLNRLFLGPPGTGKTLVAKLYGQLLFEIGALTKGEVILKNPSDLIGQYIGDSEANTKAALNAAMGNVLVIDEAHMMYTGSSDGTGNESDCYRQAIIDTIVGEVQGIPGEHRAVLLLGYGNKMQEMLQNSNPGLSRRFPIADAFWFDNFTLGELESILRSKMEEDVLMATEEAIKVAMDVLDKARCRLNFGNGGDVENLISKAKANYQGRVSLVSSSDRPEKWVFEPQDFDPEYDRGKSATLNLQKLFADVIGCEDIVKKLEQYQRVSQSMKMRNMNPKDYIPTNFVFKGPPGTGKTSTARKVAQVYYDMGFLSEASVIECSASDLVGKYVGHSGPKTTKILEKALGKVLFIDEAYRLASSSDGNSFTSEVISELVDILTKPLFHGNLVVILAGYEIQMNHLLSINPGLASRFPNELHFKALESEHCLKVLKMKLEKAGIAAPVLKQPHTMQYKNLMRLMDALATTPNWGNARDVETLAKDLCMQVLIEGGEGELECNVERVTLAMDRMLLERRARMVQSSNR